jgi:2-polyprenyl-6-methoxyphenol hydroxylase-like FAD-dependent oxidoreductase
MADVLVVGAGPTGLTMAAELSRHGVSCRIVDRLPDALPYCRAIGVTPRTLEVWEDMGIDRETIGAGLWLTGLRSIVGGGAPRDIPMPSLGLPFSDLGLPQFSTERILARHLAHQGIAIERGVAIAGLDQDGEGVGVRLERAGGEVENARFRYVVGCDGAHSFVRHALGIAFEGEAYPWPFMLGDVHIAWDLPYGMSLRALRLVEDGPPKMFIAIPLPEPGRYRVSMLAPPDLVPSGGTDHGIQAEMKGPSLDDIGAVADDLLPEPPILSDLRWSSIFRISMRLAARYRDGRVFLAGDAAHIHPPTGGQGMNTGIQDAYNLAWKLGLVLDGAAREALLDSYEIERRPVGAEVVARTRAASENYGREQGGGQNRIADTQTLVSYRGTAFVRDDADPAAPGPAAGDRAPDVIGFSQQGIGHPVRLFEALRGTRHVLIAGLAEGDAAELSAFANELRRLAPHLRILAVTADALPQEPGLTILHDAAGSFAEAYGSAPAAFLVRPDGYIGWRGQAWRDQGLEAYLGKLFTGRSS